MPSNVIAYYFGCVARYYNIILRMTYYIKRIIQTYTALPLNITAIKV